MFFGTCESHSHFHVYRNPEQHVRVHPAMDTLEELQKLKELYPHLSDKEIRIAQLTLEQYFALAWEIYEESVLSKRSIDSAPKNSYDENNKGRFPSTIN
jgi:hypothetical protein